MGAVTRTVELKTLMTDEQRHEHFARMYPASMFAVHEVIPRPLTRIEIENQQRLQQVVKGLTPIQREQLEQKLAKYNKPLHSRVKQYNFKTASNKRQTITV